MRLWMVLLMTAMVLSAADRRATKKDTKPKAIPAAPKKVQIPAEAVQIGPSSYRYTGLDGKTLLYTKTPFGISVIEEKAQPTSGEDHRLDAISATEGGDNVQFARPTPFGMIHWQTKKSDLNQTEQALWNRELTRQALALEPVLQPVQGLVLQPVQETVAEQPQD